MFCELCKSYTNKQIIGKSFKNQLALQLCFELYLLGWKNFSRMVQSFEAAAAPSYKETKAMKKQSNCWDNE